MMTTAQPIGHLRCHVGAVDHDEVALIHLNPVEQSSVVGCSLPTPTARLALHWLAYVSELKHSGGPGKQLTTKVGQQPEREDIEMQFVDGPSQLLSGA